MARVVYAGAPDVRAAEPPGVLEHVPAATPEAFGGLIGAAEQRTGAETQQGGNELFAAFQQQQELHNQAASDNAWQQFNKGTQDVLYGDQNDPSKPGYYSLKGEDAVRARPQVMQQIDDLRGQILGGLQNDRQRVEFNMASRRLQMFTTADIGRHYEQENTVYNKNTNAAGLDMDLSAVGLNYNNDQEFNARLAEVDQRAATTAKLQGAPPDSPIAQDTQRVYRAKLAEARINGYLAHNDWQGAQQVLNKYPEVIGAAAEPLQRRIQEHADLAQGDAAARNWRATGSIGNVGGAGGAPASEGDHFGVSPTGGLLPAPESLVQSILQKEGSGDESVSPKGAIGRFQVMPATAAPYLKSGEDLHNPQVNERVGRAVIGDLWRRYSGDSTAVQVAYNAGPAVADKWLESGKNPSVLPPETQRYIGGAAPNISAQLTQVPNFDTQHAPESGGQPASAAFAPRDLDDGVSQIEQARSSGQLSDRAADHAIRTMEADQRRWLVTTRAARQALQTSLKNGVSMLEDGRPYEYDEAQIRGLLPREQADQYIEALGDAKDYGAAITARRTMSPEEAAAKHAQLEQRLNDPNVPDYARRRKYLQTFDAAGAKMAHELLDPKEGDPAGWMAAWNPDIEAAKDHLTGLEKTSPPTDAAGLQTYQQAFGDYASKTLGIQEHLGLGPDDWHILPRAEASGITQQITANPEGAPARIQRLSRQYGQYWPQVWRDLVRLGGLPTGYQVVGQLADYDPGNAALLARGSLGAGDKEMKNLLDTAPAGGKSPLKIIEQTVAEDKGLGSYTSSMLASGASPGQIADIRHSVNVLAQADVLFNHTEETHAAANAALAVAGRYEYGLPGAPRVPVAIYDAVAQNFNATVAAFSPANLTVPPGYGTQPGTPHPDDYIRALQAAPTAITSPKGDSLWILDQQARLVRDRRGQPVSVPFDAVPRPATPTPTGGAAIPYVPF